MTDPEQPRDCCAVAGCTRAAVARGWCSTHYTRWRRTGDPGGASIHTTPQPSCGLAGCTRPHEARGLCHTHYERQRRTGTTDPAARTTRAPICTVKGCAKAHYALDLCHTHYTRQRRTGTTDLKTPTRRTRNYRARQHIRDIQTRTHSQQRHTQPPVPGVDNSTPNNIKRQIRPLHHDPMVINSASKARR